MKKKIDFEREDDGRWIAEMVDFPGAMAYGATKKEAEAKVLAIASGVSASASAKDIPGAKARFVPVP